MNYRINEQERQPSYLQLYHQLRQDIVDGVYPYGTKLPSKRLLAEEAGVSLITVEHAYGILCEEGYLNARQRSGYFAAYRPENLLTPPPPSETVVMRGVPTAKDSVFPFSVLSKTMRKVLACYGEGLLQKSPNQGTDVLRGAIAAYLARNNGMVVAPSQIIVGAGAEYLYGLILQLLGKERVYGLEDPSYEKIRQVYTAGGGICRLLKMGEDGITSHALAATDATVLHVTPFHSFPSGVTATASKRQEYLRWTKERNGYLIEDNFDSELTPSKKNEDTVFSSDKEGRVLYLNTFSHTVAPSLRVGYLVLPPSLVGVFEEKLGFYSCTVPVFEQLVLAELLQSGDFERHINRVRRARRKLQKS